MNYIPFNLNDNVRVKLTDHGRKVHREDYRQYWKKYSPDMLDKYTPPKEDKDGWSRWQLWHLMQTFGPHTSMGKPLCFNPNIELVTGE